MSASQGVLGRALFWGAITAGIYWLLFEYADVFERLAHTTVDACAIEKGGGPAYYSGATPEACAAANGAFIEGSWWYVFAPIGLAFALSYTHGLFTSLFWDVVGLKARK